MYYLFDWKIKLGLVLSCILFLACIVSFLIAWNSPVPSDSMTAITKFINYRWFAALLFGFISISSATAKVYHKRINRW
nr:hypothetical protein BCU52_15630 [Vibrio cyclitrophicus]